MEYLNELKVAVINSDFAKMEELSNIMFTSLDKSELEEAAALIANAIGLLDEERAKTLEEMRNIQKIRKYAEGDAKYNIS